MSQIKSEVFIESSDINKSNTPKMSLNNFKNIFLTYAVNSNLVHVFYIVLYGHLEAINRLMNFVIKPLMLVSNHNNAWHEIKTNS